VVVVEVVVVVVGGRVVVVEVVVVDEVVEVVAPAQGLGEHVPGPMLMPPLFWHAFAVFSWHTAPLESTAWQHWIVGPWSAADREPVDPHGSPAHEPLDVVPTQTLPPRGARHEAARRMVWQWVTPLASVRQHRTASGRPQVEPPAQATSCALHSSESVPLLTAAWATPATQRT